MPKILGPFLFLCAAFFFLSVGYGLSPASRAEGEIVVEIKPGDGFFEIASYLEKKEVIRSAISFRVFSLLNGTATRLKSGVYKLSPSMSTPAVITVLVTGLRRETEVAIPDGASVYLVDSLLSENGIIPRGSLIAFARGPSEPLEGKLFPDRYRFFLGSDVNTVLKKFEENFETKAAPLLRDPKNSLLHLVLASLLEKEVPDHRERQMVAGILKKRAALGMPLQVDATICYAKEVARGSYLPCTLSRPLDFKIDSPYNTYLYKGWPPGPIGSPGRGAIEAAASPLPTPYWFYLSDPRTKKTIFARTLDEHNENRVKYLAQ